MAANKVQHLHASKRNNVNLVRNLNNQDQILDGCTKISTAETTTSTAIQHLTHPMYSHLSFMKMEHLHKATLFRLTKKMWCGTLFCFAWHCGQLQCWIGQKCKHHTKIIFRISQRKILLLWVVNGWVWGGRAVCDGRFNVEFRSVCRENADTASTHKRQDKI